ncbi:hypothetical protein M9H77_21952 [Catharanthus roseus]|uniref:Uncharacterized protein n=1 Tax=Catharanthus roseus TaxID=4058 RepID=A0ACC0APX4_CATRO|nr:hypothetical protein M9H77_21952 [Catharanthus roseus]
MTVRHSKASQREGIYPRPNIDFKCLFCDFVGMSSANPHETLFVLFGSLWPFAQGRSNLSMGEFDMSISTLLNIVVFIGFRVPSDENILKTGRNEGFWSEKRRHWGRRTKSKIRRSNLGATPEFLQVIRRRA